MSTLLPFRHIIVLTLMILPAVLSQSPAVAAHTPHVLPAEDSIVIQTKAMSRAHRIGLYADASNRAVFFSVKGERGRVYQLFVFDMDGKLVKQSEIRNKQTSVISEIDKGHYIFNVFCDDDQIGTGRLSVL